MGKKPSLSETKQAQIVILHQEGQSERQIAQKLHVSKTAVHQTLVRFEQTGSY